jgi:hypothetical protein
MKMNKIERLHWPLIIGMAALALVWPFFNVTGIMDVLGRPLGPILTTLLISAAWLTIVVLGRVRHPLLTLLITGLAYGAFSFVLGAVLGGESSSPLANPVVLPFALLSTLVTNGLRGLIVGILALGIQNVWK